MGKEDGDNRVLARLAGAVKGGLRRKSRRIDVERGIFPENLLHLFHFATIGCPPESQLHCFGNKVEAEREERERECAGGKGGGK